METKQDILALGPTHTVLLYEPTTGAILHTHLQMTLQGENPPSRHDLEKDAVISASRHHANATQLGILHTENLKPRTLYRVDVQKRSLIELPFPTPKRPKGSIGG